MELNRRRFVFSVAASGAAVGQQGPPREEPVEKMTPGPKPAIALNHLGFLPDARKILVFRAPAGSQPSMFTARDIGSPPQPFSIASALKRVSGDFGDCLIGDFSNLKREAMYQISVDGERSVPFFIRSDVWRRTLPKAVSFHTAERCGIAVPNVHQACHLDDARRRDNGEYIDMTGGWHDAGDLRKWMTATMTNGFGLLYLARHLGKQWDQGGSGVKTLLEEARWGNRYFLKMQDTDGRVFADVAGGVNGDNSDNHWTDNVAGNNDDRYVNTAKNPAVQCMFTALQALAAQEYRSYDPSFGQQCLAAGVRCWKANPREGATCDLGWWLIAATELSRATKDPDYAAEAARLAQLLLARQQTAFAGNQRRIRGYFQVSATERLPFTDAVYSAIPAIALLMAASQLPAHPAAGGWRDAVRMYLDEYVTPLSERSAFRIIPFGVFHGSPTPESYRPLDGELTYRYFLPVRKQFWWLGTTSHLEIHAALLGMAARVFDQREYRDLGYRQMEWVMGANPFGACLMTGEGMRNVYPHSRFAGLINGGIVNGIAGNAKDEPILDTEYGYDWRTTEYWSPHNAWYLWATSQLERM
ncbi:MAG TPA: glycoside hydrolase family 9 protein [Bryobacteraceae bacterium]|nr:glycoside hydrolase family 9 protein [Bryobacteraceae bacterium]